MLFRLIVPLLICIIQLNCTAQTNNSDEIAFRDQDGRTVGGPFENRDFFYIGLPDQIASVDTSPGWDQKGQRILITGKIYHLDGKTPAPNVTLYYYHTDIAGLYSTKPSLDQRARRHGYIRGWVKTDQNGTYSIYTIRPAAYPNSKEPAHIHPSIKEPDISVPYWIDEFVFQGDPLLTDAKANSMRNRGGSGVLDLQKRGELLVAKHDIILGLNIPNYPQK